jgi:fatty-acyl-CoA synthase
MRGLNITPGYWNRPDANASSFVDGWFRSGDVGRQDEEGYFYIEDRVKDMYITGGENVYPAEVENALYAMEAIHEVAVIGLPDPKWGECGCAVVVPRPGASVTIEDIKAYCGERLARYKHPARLEIVDALPRNATGKVLKFELRERFGGAPQPIG